MIVNYNIKILEIYIFLINISSSFVNYYVYKINKSANHIDSSVCANKKQITIFYMFIYNSRVL